ncbi:MULTISPECIES: hypothetical protein [unclassified Rhizobium]|uniref:hypothetical protein n=1 Tax=unclassified Rhizobium TaxID=2613769 RepID=UPI001ADA681D|nr:MULTISPECIES: hypothetical protein [unclassified Rhizobium]MBO9126658.1 hypothetical protein [Rhizobium sp. 16-488-2b]MBO9177105.1 hypothetical protein [Rhizobium sp. 16-488-2a]
MKRSSTTSRTILAATILAALTMTSSVASAEDGDVDYQCVSEAAAFIEVADLAYSFRSESGVFTNALDGLRDQLIDCLVATDRKTSLSQQSDGDDEFKWKVHGPLPQ